MAMYQEGGEGTNIEYVEPSDNRGAGSWVNEANRRIPPAREAPRAVFRCMSAVYQRKLV